MTKSPRKKVPDVGIELGATCMPSDLASDRAIVLGPVPFRSTADMQNSFNPVVMMLLLFDIACVLKCFRVLSL